MPIVQIKLIEGVFSSEQKRQMLSKVTDAMLSIEGENLRPVTFVLIKVKSRRLGDRRQALPGRGRQSDRGRQGSLS